MGDSKLAIGPQAERVVLAHEASFRIGDATVQPQARKLERGGERVTLEPRVMQVLVALARAQGAVVTRDELIESCWNGRIVGDDAINRVIVQIRQLTNGLARGSFAVETIPRVGYRLVAGEAAPEARAPGSRPSRRGMMIGAAATLGVAAGAALIVQTSNRRRAPDPLALQHYRRALENRGQASIMHTEQAVAYLREATRIDPDFADAWGALAWGYRGLLEFGPRPDAARIEMLARSAAARALDLSGGNADAEATLLLLRPIYGNWLETEIGCRRLLEKYPDHSLTEYNLGLTLSETGRWRDSQPYIQAVAEREPFWPLPRMWLTRALLSANRVEEAEEVLDGALRRWPKRIDFWLMKIHDLLFARQFSQALSFAADLRYRPAEFQDIAEMQIDLTRALSEDTESRKEQVRDQVRSAAKSGPAFAPLFIMMLAMLGDTQSSFEMLEGFFFRRGAWAHLRSQRPSTNWLFIPPAQPLRQTDQFQGLVRGIGLETYWAQSKSRPDYLGSD